MMGSLSIYKRSRTRLLGWHRQFPLLRWRGRRPIAMLVLLLLLGAQALAMADLLPSPRLWVFDLYQRLLPRAATKLPVGIVAIDDASLQQYGEWPWSRQLTAALIDRIMADHPLAIGVDFLMPAPDSTSPQNWVAREPGLPADLVQALAARPDHDQSLAATLSQGPVVLGLATRWEKTGLDGPIAPIHSFGGALDGLVANYPGLLRSLPVLDRAAAGHGLIATAQTDPDGIIRQWPLIELVGGQPVPALTLDMMRLATQSHSFGVEVEPDGGLMILLPHFVIPTAGDGRVALNFAPHDPGRFTSAATILDATAPSGQFNGRFVLIGLSELQQTPLGPMPGIEIQAQLLETMLDQSLVLRPRQAALIELAASLLLGLGMIALVPVLPLRWTTPVALVPPCLLFLLGLLLYRREHWLVDTASPALNGLLIFVTLLAGTLVEADQQRRRFQRELAAEKLTAARMAGEIEAARRIQYSILPDPQRLPADPRFDLAAIMEPAKEVGGDLYDFFMIDADHLFFGIGDVSGKGVPASLFMALGKSLYKSCVLRGNRDIAAIMIAANTEISRDNIETLFITLFAGIINLTTGRVVYCNAGHDAPLAVRPGQLPKNLARASGPPLCIIDDYQYTANILYLQPGEILCLTTDGVTEAMNARQEMLGRSQIARALAGLPERANAAQALSTVRQQVADFVGDAEPSDDLTLVTLRWIGV